VKCFAWLAILACVAQAHEIGTTRTSVVFQDHSYDVEVVTDANALLEKLQATTGSTSQDLASFEETLRHRVVIEFGDREVRPAISYRIEPAEDDPSAPGAIIHLTGSIPDGAKEFHWTFGWTFASYALSTRTSASREPVTQWLEGGERSGPIQWTVPASENRLAAFLLYLRLGFTHIVPHGLDHILFVLGIYLLSRRASVVLLQVSAFTLAHSLTLGLSLYGVVSVSPSIVEPLIALSIAYVAIENLFLSELKPWRLALVFAFGLLHGLGFAGALRELELPRSEFVTALVGFNLGVEAGQLSVVGAAFALVGWYCSNRDWYRQRVAVPASLMIAFTAVYWVMERLA